MATRIYLPSSGSAAVIPSTWNFPNQINPLTFAGVMEKIGSALTTKQEATGTTSPIFKAMLRYVIGPLQAVQISGTVHLQMLAMESNAGANATFAIAIKIIKPDGSDRAVLLAYTASDSATSPYEFLTALTNRRVYNASEVQPIPLTAQTPTVGDYLVIEIGFRSATATTRNISLRYGDTITGDMPDDTTSTLDYAPWIDFSQTLSFIEAKSGIATISSNGSLNGDAKKGARGSGLKSGGGLLLAVGLAAMLGIGSISGAGSQLGTGQKNSIESAAISGGGSIAAIGEVGEEEHSGAASISGTGSVLSDGKKGGRQSASVFGNGILVLGGERWAHSSLSIAGNGSLAADGLKANCDVGIIHGNGIIGSIGDKAIHGTTSISGISSISGIGQKETDGILFISGNGELAAFGTSEQAEEKFGVAIISGNGELLLEGRKNTKEIPNIHGNGTLTGQGKKQISISMAISAQGILFATATKNSMGTSRISGGGGVSAGKFIMESKFKKMSVIFSQPFIEFKLKKPSMVMEIKNYRVKWI